MSSTFKTRCRECGWRGFLALTEACPSCGSKGGQLSPAATRRLEILGMTPLERLNARPREVQFKRIEEALYGIDVRVIPRKAARTAKATAASKTRRRAPVERVSELTAADMSAAEIGVKLGVSARWVRKLRARARREVPGQGSGTEQQT